MGEFDLIDKFFTRSAGRDDVLIGTGDDAALVNAGDGDAVICALATLISNDGDRSHAEGEQFAEQLTRAAFNRLAARGASPSWLTLSLTLPEPLSDWLDGFSSALHATASAYGAALIGGDTTRGPLSATLFAHGLTSAEIFEPMRGLSAGDAVYVTGSIGVGMRSDQSDDAAMLPGIKDIPPRIDAGVTASGYVSAAADIRHSLAATLIDLLDRFGLGADIQADSLPVTGDSASLLQRAGGPKLLLETCEDSELCFLVPPDREPDFCAAMRALPTPCTRIGVICNRRGVHVDDKTMDDLRRNSAQPDPKA